MKNRAIAAMSLMLVSVLVGCSPLFTDPPDPSVSPSSVPVTSATTAPAFTSPSSAPVTSATKAGKFTSPLYGYTVALPPDWSAQPSKRWIGIVTPGPVDVFHGMPYIWAWAFAVKRPASPAAYATVMTKAAAQLPCPAAPGTSQAVTIGGVPAELISMRCPARGGVLMLTAFTIGRQPALVITFEDSSGFSSVEGLDRAAFRQFLAGIRLRA